MAKRVVFKKQIANTTEIFYPQTSANNVIMDSGETVETAFNALKSRVDSLYDILDINQVFMTDSSGELLDDGSGTNLVAIY